MVPRVTLPEGHWLQRLPAPLQSTTTEGYLAYRLDGMEAVPSPQNLSVGTLSSEQFGKEWAKLAPLRASPVVTTAASFRRVTASASGRDRGATKR